jgi:hypothetical protein
MPTRLAGYLAAFRIQLVPCTELQQRKVTHHSVKSPLFMICLAVQDFKLELVYLVTCLYSEPDSSPLDQIIRVLNVELESCGCVTAMPFLIRSVECLEARLKKQISYRKLLKRVRVVRQKLHEGRHAGGHATTPYH